VTAFADPRFLLPAPPRSANVLLGADAWRPLLERAGVDTTAVTPPDVVITGPEPTAGETQGAPAVIVEGNADLDGYQSRRYVVFGSRDRPALLVPRDGGNVLSYALSAWSTPRTRPRVLRRYVIARLPRLALRLAGWPVVTIATHDASQPYVVAAALQLLEPESSVDWLLVCGQSDDLGRAAFLLFPQGEPRPHWIVKFVRVPSYPEPIDRDERALTAVAEAGGAAAAHAPRLVGRFEAGGLAASIETAARGRRLSAVLGSAGSRAAKKRVVGAVADWIVRVGVETRHDGAGPELERLRNEVITSWPAAPDDLLHGLSGLPAVLQHNDLGPWNIISEGGSEFTAVDWESANPSGLPLWDLWYFLAHALRLVDGKHGADGTAFSRLFRGEAASSPELFRWTRTAVEALDIPPEAVGRLATLCWLHHGLSREARSAALDRVAQGGETLTPAANAYQYAWLSDPALGSGWRSWVDGGGDS
jgi:hypothetical protein